MASHIAELEPEFKIMLQDQPQPDHHRPHWPVSSAKR
jgi:hypothetical protein